MLVLGKDLEYQTALANLVAGFSISCHDAIVCVVPADVVQQYVQLVPANHNSKQAMSVPGVTLLKVCFHGSCRKKQVLHLLVRGQQCKPIL